MVDTFSLKLQRDKRKNALTVDPPKGKTRKKLYFFYRTVEMKQPHTITEPIKSITATLHHSNAMTEPFLKAMP